MKQAFVLIALMMIVTYLYSQTNNTTFTSDYYIQKSKSQNKTGGILLGVGSTMLVVGVIGFDKNFVIFEEGGDDTKAQIYGLVALAGIVVDLVSIPVFISASRNKKRAANLVINNQILPRSIHGPEMLQCQAIPSLTLKINF